MAPKNSPAVSPESHFLVTFPEHRLFDAFWSPFGSLLAPFWSLLVDFGSLLAPFSTLLAPILVKKHVRGHPNPQSTCTLPYAPPPKENLRMNSYFPWARSGTLPQAT